MEEEHFTENCLTVNEKLMTHLHLLENKIIELDHSRSECNNTIEYCAHRLIEMTKEKVTLILQIQDLECELNDLKLSLKATFGSWHPMGTKSNRMRANSI